MTVSGRAATTASRSAAASNTSQMTGTAPRAANRSALSGDRVIPDTSWPAPTSNGTSRIPSTPLAPARKILTAYSMHRPGAGLPWAQRLVSP